MADSGTSIATPVAVQAPTPGTPVALPTSASGIAAKAIIVQALATNEAPIVVGDSNVKAKAGTHETPEVRGIELEAKAVISIDIIDAAPVWFDVRKAKDGVSYMLLLA